MIAIVTPRPAGPWKRRQTSVEFYARAVARRLARSRDVALLSPGRGARRRAGRLRYIQPDARPGRTARRLVGRAVDLRPAVLQVENRPAWALLARRLGYRGPLVLNLHSLNFLRPSRLPPERARRSLAAASAVVCVSDFIADGLRSRFGPRIRRLVRIYPGTDPRRFRPADTPALERARRRWRARWGAAGRSVVLFAGRVAPSKGLHVLIEACAGLRSRHPRLLLVVAGWPAPGPGARGYAGRVWRLARRLGVSLRVAGRIGHERMPYAYRAADVLAVPSHGREGFPLVNLEAMATGLPVAASPVGGIPEQIEDGVTGLLVHQYTSPAAWKRALDRLLADAELRRRLGTAGREHVARRFTWDRTARAFDDLYRSLTEASAADPRRE